MGAYLVVIYRSLWGEMGFKEKLGRDFFKTFVASITVDDRNGGYKQT